LLCNDENLHFLIEEIVWVITVGSIYHLDFFSPSEFYIGVLIEIINVLPDLISLKIWSIALIQLTCLSIEELNSIRYVANNNKITKIYLEKMITFEEILFLIDLFPRLKYLQVGCTSNIDIQLFVRVILTKILDKTNHCVRLLAFRIPTADEEMIKKLQKMIDFNKLLFDYRIKRISDTVYLQWE